jgi:hypothetical protein
VNQKGREKKSSERAQPGFLGDYNLEVAREEMDK